MGKRKAVDSDGSEDGASSPYSSPQEEDEGTTFVVELIREAKIGENGKAQYLVRWDGYSSDNDSWEPEDHVIDCNRLLKSFWNEFGLTYKRGKRIGQPGRTYIPLQSWIDKETAYFRNTVRKEKKKEENHKEKKAKLSEKKKTPPRREDLSSLFADVRESPKRNEPKSLFSESESDEAPLQELAKGKSKGKEKESAIDKEKNVKGNKKSTVSSVARMGSNSASKGLAPLGPVPKNKFAGMKMSKTKSLASTEPRSFPSDPGPSVAQVSFEDDLRYSGEVSQSVEKGTPNTDISRRPIISAPLPAPRESSPPPIRPNIPLARRPSAQVSPIMHTSSELVRASDEDVDNILATIIPFEASKAQKPGTSTMKTWQTNKALADLKFEKKWSWSGELFLDNDANAAERVCDIQIKQTYEPNPGQPGLRLNTIMDSKDTLRLRKSFTHSEVNIILRSVKRVDQIAAIQYRGHSDKNPYETFSRYLGKANLVAATPAMSTYGHVGEMIIFSANNDDICKRFKVPPRLLETGLLLMALLPCHFMPSVYEELWRRPDEIRLPPRAENLIEIRRKVPKNLDGLDSTIQILNFPPWFIEWVFLRKFTVWASGSGQPFKRGVVLRTDNGDDYTKALFELLERLNCENVGLSEDVRVVFIHVGAVATAHHMPALGKWRCERPDMRFVTYGTHEHIVPREWGFREIWTIGGVVTFTPEALFEDLVGVENLIRQVDKHPLWTCYIHPFALSIFIRMSCPGDDPMSVYMKDNFRFGKLLSLIEQGKVALTRSPEPTDRVSTGTAATDTSMEWIIAQLSQITKTPLDLVEDSYGTFIAQYSNKMEHEAMELVEKELAQDLLQLHAQPAIRCRYRRYVIIKSSREVRKKTYEDGIEWRMLQEFDVKDGFQSSTVLDF